MLWGSFSHCTKVVMIAVSKKKIYNHTTEWQCLTSSFQRCAVAVRAAISHGKTQRAVFHRRTVLSLGHDSHKRLPNSKESVFCAQSIIRKRRAASPTSPFEGFLPPSPSADLLSEYYVPGVNCSPNALVLQAAKGTFSTTLEAVFSVLLNSDP